MDYDDTSSLEQRRDNLLGSLIMGAGVILVALVLAAFLYFRFHR